MGCPTLYLTCLKSDCLSQVLKSQVAISFNQDLAKSSFDQILDKTLAEIETGNLSVAVLRSVLVGVRFLIQ